MSRETDIAGHAVWSRLAAVRQLCNPEGWPDNADARAALSRVTWIVDQTQARFEATTPNGVATATLDNLHSMLTNLESSVTNVRAGSAPSCADVNSYCDQILVAIGPWAPARATRAVQSAIDAGTTYRAAVEAALGSLNEQVAARQADLTRVREELDRTAAEFQRTTEETTTKQQVDVEQQLAAVRADVARIAQTAQEQTNRVDSQLNTLNATFQQAETVRAQESSTAMEKARDQFADVLADLDAEGKVVIEALEEMRGQARNILQVMGIEATTSEYSSYAKQERKAGHLWNSIAVFVGLAGAAGYLWTVISLAQDARPSWQLVSMKAAFGTVLLLVAGYAGRQASGHRAQERRSKGLALALGVLDPLLANIEPDDAKKLRAQVVARIVAGHEEPHEEEGSFGLAPLARAVMPGNSKTSDA